MIVQVSRKDLFIEYLRFLDPVLSLKDNDRKVLGALLSLWYAHRFYPVDTLYGLLFSEDTQKAIREKLELSESQYNKSFKKLQEKGLIEDNTLNKTLLGFIKDNKFEIKIQFKVEG